MLEACQLYLQAQAMEHLNSNLGLAIQQAIPLQVCQLYLEAWAYLHLYIHIHKVLFVMGNPLVSSTVSNCAAMKTLRSSMAGSGPSSTSPFFPISENGVFGVIPSSTSGGLSFQFAASSSQNAARNFGAVAASSS